MTKNHKQTVIVIFIVLAYIILNILSLNFCYFWDNIQQVSKEAHWYYLTNFKSLLMPAQDSGAEIVATGYHPPLMGIMTAALWKVFGYHLWVSHVFSLCWFFVLIYNLRAIVNRFFNQNLALWVLAIVLLESTLLTQFVIASPDLILFAAFILSLRAIIERKSILLTIGIFFLCTINMRGIFVGSALFISHLYYIYSDKQSFSKSSIKVIFPYLPTFIVLFSYFSFYLVSHGWFFRNSTYSEHYSLPTSPFRIIKHIAEFGLRSVENGRIVIWIASIITTYLGWKNRKQLSAETKFLILFFAIITSIYIVFVFITQMPFSARYFMPQFFVLTILTILGLRTHLKQLHLKYAIILIFVFELSGNLWIYPDKIAISWDCTLAHLPYYELRKDCLSYIDKNKIDNKEVSGGFCLYGNRQFVELDNVGKTISSNTNNKYFIYSNISNLDDDFVDELRDKKSWTELKVFKKGFVEMIIYKRIPSQTKN